MLFIYYIISFLVEIEELYNPSRDVQYVKFQFTRPLPNRFSRLEVN